MILFYFLLLLDTRTAFVLSIASKQLRTRPIGMAISFSYLPSSLSLFTYLSNYRRW